MRSIQTWQLKIPKRIENEHSYPHSTQHTLHSGALEASITCVMFEKFPHVVFFILLFVGMLAAIPATAADDEVFQGKIGRTVETSVASWPEPTEAPDGAPNILIWLIDDAGFGHTGTFGGLIDTPSIDRLAQRGLRYNNFHTTALCSASRAALMAGRNHHSVGMGSHALLAMGFPGYNGRTPKSAATVAKVLQQRGYTTMALGKWDHTPPGDVTIAGPFDRWPSGDGFDHFYGFMSADTNNFKPAMWADHTPIEPAAGKPDYHLSTDMADKAISFITGLKSARPERPFFMYWATGAVHAPHHAPADWIEKYKGRMDMGWDKAREMIFARQKEMGVIPEDTQMPPRPDIIPAWDSLPADARRMYARQMEVFAAQLSHADYEFGRIIAMLEQIGELDNTLIIVASDNGASAEGGLGGTYSEARAYNGLTYTSYQENLKRYDEWGGPDTYPHFHAGWAVAGNTPFKWFKQQAHRGGQHDPLVISWPNGIKAQGEIRSQYHHIIDIMPTVLEAAGIELPEFVDGVKQQPLDGIAMNYSFDNIDAKDRRTVQYYEMFGNRAIYANGLKAVARHGDRMPWNNIGVSLPYEDDTWELYDLSNDFAESRDLAAENPEKLAALQLVLDEEFFKYNVYPLNDELLKRITEVFVRFGPKGDHFVYYPPGAQRITEALSPPIKNRSYTITAEITVPPEGAEGVILTAGGNKAGYALYIKDGRVVYDYNYFADAWYTIISDELVPPGDVTVALKFTRTGQLQGKAELFLNGNEVGEIVLEKTVPSIFSLEETMDVGVDTGTPVSKRYETPFGFTGVINQVVIDLE